MKGDLYINGKDAWVEWGVNMGDGFLDAIDAFAPMKAIIENESRIENGKRVIVKNPVVASRDLTLKFVIKGADELDFRNKRKAFELELRKVTLDVTIPVLGEGVFHLLYTGNNVAYAMNPARTICTISAKFEEPNPADRTPRA